MSFKIQRHAVRGVYRCIVRHLAHIDPSLIKQVHRQFARRKEYAKIGHVRAAYELEAGLRAVALGQKSISEVKAQFKQKKPKQLIERNAITRHQLWKSMDERRLDEYNTPPAPNTLKYSQVHMAAGLHNLRHRFLHNRGISPQSACDFAVVDTVLAPAFVNARMARKRRIKEKRESTPRQVRLHSITRDGVVLHTLRIQGYKASTRGFGRLFKSLLKNRRQLKKISDLHESITKTMPRHQKDAIKRSIGGARRKLSHQNYFRVQRLVLLKRAERVQKQLNYMFRLEKQREKARKPTRPRLRLIT